MRQVLRKRLPSHGVFGEEGGLEAGAGEWTWVLDPIDGTKSFITGSVPAAAPATQREKASVLRKQSCPWPRKATVRHTYILGGRQRRACARRH